MTYYLSLGSNIGHREEIIEEALRQIEEGTGTVKRRSSFYYSAPWGFESEHDFCNLCCQVESSLSPLPFLRATQAIERHLGRTHKSVNGQYSDRTIDIDLIRAFDDRGKEVVIDYQLSASPLILPHPLWKERDFVREPLEELLSGAGPVTAW